MASMDFKRYPKPKHALPNFLFMKLPIEIRYMVYEILLIRPKAVYRAPPRTTVPLPRIASCGGGVAYMAHIPEQRRRHIFESCDAEHHDCYVPHIPDLALLLANRQIHAEAAPFFYGRNVFRIRLGINPHLHCQKPVWDLVDDLADISKRNLKFMRFVRLDVRAFDFSGDFREYFRHASHPRYLWDWPTHYAKSSYLDVKARLERFAEGVRGEHRLRLLAVRIDGYIRQRFDAIDRIQNVLEPLASIYGIEHVIIGGVTYEFAARMVRAMEMRSLAVEKIPETYGKKVTGSRKTKKVQLYKTRRYMESSYKFLFENGEDWPWRTSDRIARKARSYGGGGLPWKVVLCYELDREGYEVGSYVDK
ncbi:MAG: hypothetical protein L6R40_004651 [Gallowayella cf. fulva]|nr:MAG: hypothetical protein L6R40_004651 [Xanthomendoza cf. fulva]